MGEGVTRLENADHEQHEPAAATEHHRERKRPHRSPPVAPIGNGVFRGAVRGPLSESEPQGKARHHAERDRHDANRQRNPERHQQRKRRNDQQEADEAGNFPRQRDQQHTEQRDGNRTTRHVSTGLASKFLAIGEHTIWNGHVRNAIRFLSRDVRGHERFIVLAVVAAVSARLGSELASHWSLAFTVSGGISRVLTVPQAWWLICGAAVVAALIDGNARTPHPTASVRVPVRSLVIVAALFAVHGATEWHRLATPRTGEYSGVVFARSDATAKNNTVTLVVEVERENFRIVARGSSRNALHHVRMGDVLLVDGMRVAYDERRLRFVAGRHLQGELQQVVVHATGPSQVPWHRAANRIHDLIDRGSRTMPSDDAALVRGLVLGDESRQPSRMTEAFRAAGLGHLLAVSGQNVVLILAALTPALQRLTRWTRLATALGLVAMFAVVTRLESSVVRACVMAAVTQVGFAIGRDLLPLRALALTVAGIVAVDPLATWSIGFVLSVAATAGLIIVTPWLGETIFAATAAAQLAVSPFVVWWFGSVPSLALITNVVAVPVASFVMVVGPPLLVVSAFLPDLVAEIVSIPIIVSLRWVWWVAEWGLRLSPPAWLNVLAWLGIVAYVVKRIADEVRYVGHPSARL